jgi:hypothetical protein
LFHKTVVSEARIGIEPDSQPAIALPDLSAAVSSQGCTNRKLTAPFHEIKSRRVEQRRTLRVVFGGHRPPLPPCAITARLNSGPSKRGD